MGKHMDFRKGKGREDPEINLIPFIDVLLVILIFLMITTTYSKYTTLQITLPTADAEKAMEQPSEINVVIDAQGRYEINGSPVSFHDVAGLAEDLKSVAGTTDAQKAPVVVINADAMAAHQTVVNVMHAANLAGLPQINFVAQSSGKK
jgi:biopolymer transport protein ExbD